MGNSLNMTIFKAIRQRNHTKRAIDNLLCKCLYICFHGLCQCNSNTVYKSQQFKALLRCQISSLQQLYEVTIISLLCTTSKRLVGVQPEIQTM